MRVQRLKRYMAHAALLLALASLQACACLESDGQINKYQFTVLRPERVVIYKPVGGQPPANDRVFIYLAIENNSEGPRSICFACYSHRSNRWYRVLDHDVVPVVEVTSQNAPIIGTPEVSLGGAGGQIISPFGRFPEIIPDVSEFPLNEANYRRDFAIILHPDRSQIDATGVLRVRVTLARPKHSWPDDGQPQVAAFSIPVTISGDFRPETMTTEPSQPSQ